MQTMAQRMPLAFGNSRILLATVVLTGAIACGGDSTPPHNPIPVIRSFRPGVLTSGSNGGTMTVSGDGFLEQSQVQWNGNDRPVVARSSGALAFQLSAQDVANVGEGQITVENPPPGGGQSLAVTVPVRPPLPRGDFFNLSFYDVPHRPQGITAAGDGFFYVAQMDGRSVMKGRTSITVGSLLGEVSLSKDEPVDVALDPEVTRAYTANRAGRSVSVIDVATNTLITNISLPDRAAKVLVSTAVGRIYVSTVEGHVYGIDPTTKQVVTTTAVSAEAYGMALDAASSKLYVSSRSGPISEIDLTTSQVVRTYPVDAGSERIALSPDGATLYVAGGAGLDVLDLATGTYTLFPGLPSGATGLALSGRNLLVTFPGSGILERLDLPTRTIVNTLTNMGEIYDVAISSVTGKVLVSDEYGRLIDLAFY